ncbi:haloacid dehalogenase-like hydrolase [Aerococcus urinae]|uniref:Haloacid dehalogenase-like hydrolase n=1 Tax=Aerococcus urinae TaxID=1376 RepID=A0A7T2VTZ5_9LACT|nr:haloacid dehalogenase-like hydrolase [Aerococcus urinae]AMB95321.1 hypothetical protein AWM73_01760 [Aerococcus urinae]MCY3046893.1 haloacid dehalogenase-like hydrolase [Aerococcus urinae]QPS01355.1 haloacid dehalogenase-like hydrolase [Aerococcus urinae]
MPQLAPKNWEPQLYHRLDQLIKTHQQPRDTPLAQKNYVVFDFDHTSIFNDIEDHSMVYTAAHLAYQLSPSEMRNCLSQNKAALDQALSDQEPQISFQELIDDIIADYQKLYPERDDYQKSQKSLEERLEADPLFFNFFCKIRTFYLAYNQHFPKQAGASCPSFLYHNFTEIDFVDLGKKALAYGLRAPIKDFTWTYSLSGDPRQCLSTHFSQGLRIPNELIKLYQSLHTAGIATYIVSASPQSLVETAVKYFYPIDLPEIIGMSYKRDEAGIYQAQLKSDAPITKAAGKVQAIQKLIQPRHQGRDPLAVFGDNMGDYQMFQAFSPSTTRVLFNRLLRDKTQDFVSQAQKEYAKPNQVYFIQGRDNNVGALRPFQETIPFGQDQAYLIPSRTLNQ